mmetsp:Transcript_40466/g.116979  ORF Transcript_40466/g.116979 Transcript_40466/m.116979 type:complete len:609 (-) Transcript_40466:23-1849(-)
MPRLKDDGGVQQPESLFIGDLRELTTVYETGVAALFRNVVWENTSLRRQLATAGLTPVDAPVYASDSALSGMQTWSLAIPPRPASPAQPDFRSEDGIVEFSLGQTGKRRPKQKSKGGDFVSEATCGKRCETGSDYVESNLGDSEPRICRPSLISGRFVPPGANLPNWPQQVPDRSSSFASDLGARKAKDRQGLAGFVKSFEFETFISACIILNCFTVGLWAHNLAAGNVSPVLLNIIEVFEHTFVVIFTVEILLKWKALGWRAFKPTDAAGRSNFVDMMLVLFTGLVSAWLIPLLLLTCDIDGNLGIFKTLNVLRTFRLVRLVRVFQRVPLFREAWMLVHGLSDSSRTLFWTCMVISLVTYVFAIVGLALVVVELEAQFDHTIDEAQREEIRWLLSMMNGLDRMMSVLVQVLTQDSFHSFTRPIEKYVKGSWLYWYSYIAVAVFVLMNLVTALIVENAMETSKANHDHMVTEREVKRQKDIDRMRKLFKSMDTDGGGTLSWEEFSMSFDDPDLGKIWKVLDIDQKDAWELFQLLDDGDGEITINEFIEALHRMSGVAQAKDMFRLQKMVHLVMTSLDAITARSLFKAQAQAKTGPQGIDSASLTAPAQ